MKTKYTFVARKSLTLIVTVFGEDEDEAEGHAANVVGDTLLDEWDGADDVDDLELIDSEELDDEDTVDQDVIE
jgi:hypothetical protein